MGSASGGEKGVEWERRQTRLQGASALHSGDEEAIFCDVPYVPSTHSTRQGHPPSVDVARLVSLRQEAHS